MMRWFFTGMLLIGIFISVISGNGNAAMDALTNGADNAVKLTLTLCGSYILWMGIIKIAERAGLTEKLARIMRIPLGWLMPNIGEAASPVTLNLAANFFGLANAATPFGIEAMKLLQKRNGGKPRASREICMFLALNAASVELLPTSVIAVRSACGSADPYLIVLPTFISSIFGAIAAVIACRFFEGLEG